ncbi:MAG: hypothetical protein AAFR35_01305 [Pseudomonadota bacterium]
MSEGNIALAWASTLVLATVTGTVIWMADMPDTSHMVVTGLPLLPVIGLLVSYLVAIARNSGFAPRIGIWVSFLGWAAVTYPILVAVLGGEMSSVSVSASFVLGGSAFLLAHGWVQRRLRDA